MKTNAIILLTLLVGVLFFACSPKPQKSIQKRSNSEIDDIMQQAIPSRNNHFAFDIWKQLPVENDNFVVSPFSISTALAMTYAGARGQTQDEMIGTLFFDPDQDSFHIEYGQYLERLNQLTSEQVQLNLANNLWVQRDYYFLPEYFSTIEQNYRAKPSLVNFKGNREPIRKEINDWVFSQTKEKIKDLISPGVLTEDTRMVLVNAIHFLGGWSSAFDPDRSTEDTFHNIDGLLGKATFMRKQGYYMYYEDKGIQALEMPYQNGNFSMVILLPEQGSESSIHKLETRMDAPFFSTITSGMERTHTDIYLPRFEIETGLDLEKVLPIMGMPTAFSLRADFSGMTGNDSLMIDKVIHKAMIDVKESGTEAAAATAVVMIMKTSIEPEPERTVVFKADRPFLFFLKDNTYNSILFMGRVAKM